MTTPNTPAPAETNARYWLRILRPLLLWLLLVLVLYGIRTHQRLMEQTRLNFSITMQGRPLDGAATLDGHLVISGEKISLGSHQLKVTHPKAEAFSTNFFVWYGGHDFADLSLTRAQGILKVTAIPPAQTITISGPEYSLILTNTSGLTSAVPTDQYVIEAQYEHWQKRQEVQVMDGQTAVQAFAPRLGALRLEASHEQVSYELLNENRERLSLGSLPATITDLPEGKYQVIARYNEDERDWTVSVTAGTTNDSKLEFVYGAATIESEPPGATVMSGGKEYGITPVTIPELKTGTFEFSLALSDYNTLAGRVAVVAHATNQVHYTLVSRHYTEAMEAARQAAASHDYARAINEVGTALKYKPDDVEAEKLQNEVTGQFHLAQAQTLAGRGEFADAIKEAKLAFVMLPDGAVAATLVADYTAREQARVEQQAENARKRQRAELAQQQAQARIDQFNIAYAAASRTYESESSFLTHELIFTNQLKAVASGINQALLNTPPNFDVSKFYWPQSDVFILQARKQIGIGSRKCLIAGVQLNEEAIKIRFKVFEYEQPDPIRLFGGAINLTPTVTITSQDPNAAKAKAEQMQARINEGIKMIRDRIKAAAGAPTNVLR